MSQTELAEETNLSQAFISQIESGARNKRVSLANLQSIAKALGFRSLGQMIGAAEEPDPDQMSEDLDRLIESL